MSAPGYAPTSIEALLGLGAVLGGLVVAVGLLGFVRRPATARGLAWALAVGAVAVMDHAAADEPAGLRMLALCGALLYAMKGLVLTEHRLAGGASLTPARWLGFTVLWPGMRPGPFVTSERPQSVEPDRASSGVVDLRGDADPGDDARTARLARRGAMLLALGLGLVLAARAAWQAPATKLLAVPLLAVGLSLTVHFGLFHLLTAAWRRAGVGVGPLFRAPLAATSLGAFWSRRWNLAFSELMQLVIARPLRRRFGERAAVVAGFLASGVLHELALSLPVGAGYGGPLAYFALHGALVRLEPWLARRQRWLREGGPWARAWVLATLAAPLPLLFHAPFVAGALSPLLE
jgi:hypothetical protein